MGEHTITPVVDDGLASGTTSVVVEVTTPSAAVEMLLEQVEASILGPSRRQPLRAILQGACAAFDRDQSGAGINQLNAFLNQVRAQLAPHDAPLAERLARMAREIMTALGSSYPPH